MQRTLRLLSDFVEYTNVDPSDIVVISPYKPNVDWGNCQLQNYPALEGIRPVQTADTFQGCEGDMAAVVFGTNRWSGPGFTSDENRLNVMITRQRSALLLVGDMEVTGPLDGKGADKAAKAAKRGVRTFSDNGESMFIKAAMLREVLVRMHKSGRCFVVGKAEDDKGLEEGPVDNIEESWIVFVVVYIAMENLRVKLSPSDHVARATKNYVFKVLVTLNRCRVLASDSCGILHMTAMPMIPVIGSNSCHSESVLGLRATAGHCWPSWASRVCA
jgi:hypothetical protein